MPSTKTPEQYIEAARRIWHEEGLIEIDNQPLTSLNDDGEDGAYVQAWVWVDDVEVR